MHRPDRFIASCACWSDFWERTRKLPSQGEKGAVFERLTQLYLQTTPEYQAELPHVWTLRECLRMFANFLPFQPSTKASTS